MTQQESPQFTIYDAQQAIPGYQRAGVWGLAALAILLCGLAAGWLFGGAQIIPPGSGASLDGAALLGPAGRG